MNQKLKRLMIIAMMLAMAIIVNYMESFIPVFIPGVRLGLANVIILLMIYEFKFYEAFIVDILRIFIVSLLRGTFLAPVFFMSLSGGMLSLLIMFLFSRIRIFTAVGTSAAGAFFHTAGQLAVLIIISGTPTVMNYMPIIGFISIAAGVLSGFISHIYLTRSITYNYTYVDTRYKERYSNQIKELDIETED